MGSDAFTISMKALYVIFIITISVINLVLIVKQVRKPLFYQNVKAMIILSLAIGDLLLALFPLVVMADILYNRPKMKCSMTTISETYMNFLIHFVYGIGLVTLGAEVLLRHKTNALHTHKGINALFAGSIPWILGLIIILPLCLAKVDFKNHCSNSQSYSHVQSMLGVSILFPTTLAVVVTAILNLVNFSELENDTSTSLTQSQFAYQQLNTPYPNNEQGNNQDEINGLELNPCQGNQPGGNEYPSNQPEVYPCNVTRQQTINVIVENTHTTNLAAMSTSSRKTEVKRLLVIATVFFCLVVPGVVFLLNVKPADWPDYMIIVVIQIVYWLMVSRSFITPLIMIRYSDL